MNDFWAERTERERLLIWAAAAIFACAILYYLIVSPLGRWRSDAAREATRAEATYSIVREAAASAAAGNVPSASGEGQTPVRNALIQTARANGVTLNFVNPRPDGMVEAGVDVVGPDQLFTWLRLLEDRYAVTVVTADIARDGGDPGLVRAQFVFGSR